MIVVKMVVMRNPLHAYTKYNEYLKMSLEIRTKGGQIWCIAEETRDDLILK